MKEASVPIRAITSGQGRHWFGYYDKLQFDATSRYVLGMRVDFEGRQPRPDDSIAVGVIDLQAGDAWREVGRTRAWCWQQGCMLQWVPGSERRIIWNDREGDRFVSRILDLDSGASRALPAAIYAVAPDGRTAIGTDFRRLNDMRPGYGYAGIPDPNREVPAPEDAGIYTLDLTAPGAEPELVIPIAEVAALPYGRTATSARPSTTSTTCCSTLTDRASSSCTAGAGATAGGPGCSPRAAMDPTCTSSTTTAGCPTSSGAIERPSWDGPGDPARERRSTSTGTGVKR